MKHFIALLLIFIVTHSCKKQDAVLQDKTSKRGLITPKAMVVSARERPLKLVLLFFNKAVMLLMRWWLPNWLWQ